MHVSIRIKRHLDPEWQDYLGGLQIEHDTDGTSLLSGTLQDQSALYGVLRMMSQLNLKLISLDIKEKQQKDHGMGKILSKDGTAIAFSRSGVGAPIILVDGALCYRAFGPMEPLSARLSEHFCVFTYDRRGRGESGDTALSTREREIEDLEALIDEAGGSASVFGLSSGAALALEAALSLGDKVKKLALYEAPYNSDAAARQRWREYRKQLAELVAADRRGDAVALFMTLVGMPLEHLEGMRQQPIWQMFEAVGHTLAYDAAALGEDGSVPIEQAAGVTIPVLVMDGSKSFPFMHATAIELANALPRAELRTLEGQTHEVEVEVLAPVLQAFFSQTRTEVHG